MIVSPRAFEELARDMILDGRHFCEDEEKRRFRGHLGASFRTIALMWKKLEPLTKISNRTKPEHLLWTFVFLKVNSSESVHCKIVGCKSRTIFRKWVGRYVEAMSVLSQTVIHLGNRFKGWNGDTRCLMVIDATDVGINEPSPYNPIWWSHKLNGPGIRYEVAMCIQTGHIVWINGPFPCNISDRDIFDKGLSKRLLPGEGVEADNGYKGRVQIYVPGCAQTRIARIQKSHTRGRLETVNRRFKQFKCMQRWGNNDIFKHADVARAVATIVELAFCTGKELYEVEYDVNYD